MDFAQLRDLLNGNVQEAELSNFFIVGGYIGLTIGLGFIARAWLTWRKYRPLQLKLTAVIYLIAACYPLGMFFKCLVIGPDFLRWHLTDLGFAVAISILTFHGSDQEPEPNNYWKPGHPWHMPDGDNLDQRPMLRNLREQHSYRRFYNGFCLMLSFGYEFFTGALYYFTDIKVELIGNFDVWDMVGYSAGAAIAWWILRKAISWETDLIKAIDREEREALDQQQTTRRTERAAKTAAPPPRRRRRADGTRTRRRRGGRR